MMKLIKFVSNSIPLYFSAQEKSYTSFLLQLADLGCNLHQNGLRDSARAVLNLIPADAHTQNEIRKHCADLTKNPIQNPQHGFDALFFSTTPSQTLYNLDVCYR